jgi:hypothetical protein
MLRKGFRISTNDGLECLNERFDSLCPRMSQSLSYEAGQRRLRIDRIRLLADHDQGQHSIRCVLTDPEAEPTAPGRAYEVRAIEAEAPEDRYRILDAVRLQRPSER